MSTQFSREEIDQMTQRYRATFINSLGGFKSVVLIGTKDKNGQENLSIVSSLFHIGANPPLCGLIFRHCLTVFDAGGCVFYGGDRVHVCDKKEALIIRAL